ncbi:universal stress protein [Porphyromonas pogonae]|uniref:universal stress protein n=1 Tax=Porphyromonas pogonae TaxID=867595 RepID=UPI002E76DCB9|nr:universal stress protein [Porphyromonas pogonae]
MEENKLVTVAIHTYEKAEILKTILESEGIEVFLTNINQLQPMVSAGVRVRISEKDLPKALNIIENMHWNEQLEEDAQTPETDYDKEEDEKDNNFVLIPIDFSDYTLRICKIGINYAARRGLNVVLIHAYYTPFIPSPMMIEDITAVQLSTELNLKEEMKQVMSDMEKLKRDLNDLMAQGTIPQVNFKTLLRDGTPEDVILGYAKRHRPVVIVMGTRGKGKKDSDLIGSVAAEVIDSSKVPVLVVPEGTPFDDLAKVKEVAVATSMKQNDLLLFESFIKLLGHHNPKFHIFNISLGEGKEWNQIQLEAIKDYHLRHYPTREIEVNQLEQGDFGEALEKFINREHIDLIVVNTYERGFFAKLFNPSMARRMLYHSGTPMLVMRNKPDNK